MPLSAGLAACAVICAAVCTTGCGGGGPRVETVEGLAWPAADPRVRLEAVVDLTRALEGRAARGLRRLTGSEPGRAVQRPYGIAWDGDRLLVTDAGSGRVLRLDLEGGASASPPGSFATPIGVAACAGDVVVSDSRAGRVALLDRRLRPAAELATGLERPTGVVCAPGGVLVAETGRHRLLRIPLGGDDAGAAPLGRRGDGEGEFNFPVALSAAGRELWVADTLNFRLQRLDLATGGFLGAFGRLGDAPGDMPRIKGVAVDRAGHLWVSDALLDQVSLYRPGGDLLLVLGGTGQAPGRFSFPAGIAAHTDGRVAVVDSFNRRLQIFRTLAAAEPAEGDR